MNSNLLKSYLIRNGLTQRDFADKLDITPATLNAKINNKRAFKITEINKSADILHLNAEETKTIFLSSE